MIKFVGKFMYIIYFNIVNVSICLPITNYKSRLVVNINEYILQSIQRDKIKLL